MKYATITQQNSAHKVEDEEQAKIEQLVTEQVGNSLLLAIDGGSERSPLRPSSYAVGF